MVKNILVLLIAALAFTSCDDKPPIVIVDPVPPGPGPGYEITEYYYARFNVGKKQDTVLLQVPDDTTAWADKNWEFEDCQNFVFDVRNEVIYDTTGSELLDPDEDKPLKIGWHYSPATLIKSKPMIQLELEGSTYSDAIDDPEDDYAQAIRPILQISFPYEVPDDTLQFWDIQDYLENPSIYKGIIKWGRNGNNNYEDTIWNNDVQNGVVISYTDETGVTWETDNWPTFQPFGYFKINRVFSNSNDDESYDIIEGEFAARVYNDYTEYIDIREGEFRLRILADIPLSPQPK